MVNAKELGLPQGLPQHGGSQAWSVPGSCVPSMLKEAFIGARFVEASTQVRWESLHLATIALKSPFHRAAGPAVAHQGGQVLLLLALRSLAPSKLWTEPTLLTNSLQPAT